jgi:hypothetical protein
VDHTWEKWEVLANFYPGYMKTVYRIKKLEKRPRYKGLEPEREREREGSTVVSLGESLTFHLQGRRVFKHTVCR